MQMLTREFADSEGARWEALAVDAIVAHGKVGAILAFRRSDEEGEPLSSTITFNSDAAAEFALGTMSEKELRRRLSLAREAAGTL
jgi:hypothetical protein